MRRRLCRTGRRDLTRPRATSPAGRRLREPYASSLPSVVWAAAADPNDDGLGVWLKLVRPGVWQMTVDEQW